MEQISHLNEQRMAIEKGILSSLDRFKFMSFKWLSQKKNCNQTPSLLVKVNIVYQKLLKPKQIFINFFDKYEEPCAIKWEEQIQRCPPIMKSQNQCQREICNDVNT